MTTSELNRILLELYALEPELKNHETALKDLILKMSDLKPDTKFDPAFAARLKAEIEADQHQKKQIINFNFMNKKIYWATGSLAVTAVLIFVFTSLMSPGLIGPKYNWPSETISQLPAGAFGNLASLNNLSQEASGSTVAPMGLGGGGSEGAALATRSAGGDMAEQKMMIMPYNNYTYKYVGDDLELSESQGSVYRRIKGDGQSGRALANLIGGLNIAEVDLGTFSNLKATNLSLMEDKEMGLMVSLDFNEDNIFISENWERWQIAERNNCAGDQACWDRWRMKIEDVPADSSLISMANSFLRQHNVNLEHYGEPIVDNNWREMYIQATDKNNFYIPEYSTVIYPLLINDKPVRDQSGSYSGLRVTINLLRNAASGLSGLSPYRYESSSYQLETDAQKIIAVAEKGGWNRGWFGGSENVRTLSLGTPEKSLIHMWQYSNGKSSELMVPALIFPVLDQPNDGSYYGAKYITVPLAQEMLNDLNKDQQDLPIPVDGRGGDDKLIIMESADIETTDTELVPVENAPQLLIESR